MQSLCAWSVLQPLWKTGCTNPQMTHRGAHSSKDALENFGCASCSVLRLLARRCSRQTSCFFHSWTYLTTGSSKVPFFSLLPCIPWSCWRAIAGSEAWLPGEQHPSQGPAAFLPAMGIAGLRLRQAETWVLPARLSCELTWGLEFAHAFSSWRACAHPSEWWLFAIAKIPFASVPRRTL